MNLEKNAECWALYNTICLLTLLRPCHGRRPLENENENENFHHYINNNTNEPNPSNKKVTNIPKNALKKLLLAEFIIFSVFGFFDNFIMMTFGEALDEYFFKWISHTMIAAAIGNWISDLFGLATGERVEHLLNKIYPAPKLTHEHTSQKQYHNCKYLGRFCGISFGCLIGAFCALPFLEKQKGKKKSSSVDETETE